MENFNNGFEDNSKVKEKNIYLLHLDGKRILILSSILIGIVAISFLIGINYKSKNSTENDIFALNEEKLSIEDKGLDDIFKETEKNFVDNNSNKKEEVLKENNSSDLLINEKESTDDLISENSNADIKSESLKPKAVSNKTVNKKEKVIKLKKVAPKKKIAKRHNSISKKKSNLVEVSGNLKKQNLNGFSIQVVSYDSKSKALNEVNKLKNMNYTVYSDIAKVNGINYYRVRIGPYKSKQSALNLLNKIQSNPRYAESYMIKE